MLTDAQRATLVDLYVTEGLSMLAVAERLGVGASTVRRWLREAGIPARTHSQAAELQWGARAKLASHQREAKETA